MLNVPLLRLSEPSMVVAPPSDIPFGLLIVRSRSVIEDGIEVDEAVNPSKSILEEIPPVRVPMDVRILSYNVMVLPFRSKLPFIRLKVLFRVLFACRITPLVLFDRS